MALETKQTRSGLFLRRDDRLGLLVFSPFTGLMWAIHRDYEKPVAEWLESKEKACGPTAFRESLGAGWSIDISRARFPTPHLLPSPKAWKTLEAPDHPILINWFLTGRWPLACKYCYAEDLMRNESLEPDKEAIVRIAHEILARNPLAVVLTGGDPLFSPFLATALEVLSGRVGLILDTSGYTFNERHLRLFRQHQVSVRISLDSDRPHINQYQRPLHRQYEALAKSGVSTLEAAISALSKCLEAGLSVTVQTVATRKNANDLPSLGDKLFRLGVSSWRVFKVAPSQANYQNYLSLVGEYLDDGRRVKGKQAAGPYEYIFARIRELAEGAWERRMAVQLTYNETSNSVILVSPDGVFYTESNVNPGKVVLDERNVHAPSKAAILSKVNMLAHAERYLNVTGPQVP